MNFHEFLLLNKASKSSLLYKEAIYVGKRKQGSLVAVLYQLSFFYVEILYKKYRYEIKEIECFETTDILDEYPQQVCIEEFV